MKTLKHTLVLGFILLINSCLIGQNILVNGKVSGIDGPLNKAKIKLADSKILTKSNVDGIFTIEVPTANSRLIISYKGASKIVTLENGQINEKIELIPTEKRLHKEIVNREEIRLCDIYLKHYANGKYSENVKKIREKQLFIQAYNLAASQFSDTALRNYIKQYPHGAYLEKAKDAIEIACWQKACSENTTLSYEEYLEKYPNGKATKIAKNKIARLK